MGKGQRSKRSRYVREIARNCEVAEDIYNGKIKIKREHVNKYAGEEFKKKKKKSKHPVTIDNKINMVIDNMNNEVAKIRKENDDKISKIRKGFDYAVLGLIVIVIIVMFVIGVMNL